MPASSDRSRAAAAARESETPRAPEASPLSVLLIGSLPPPIGGTTISFQQLARELESRGDVEIQVIDTSRGDRTGRLYDVWAALRVAARLLPRVGAVDVVTFHASTPATVLFGPIIQAVCTLYRRPLVLREFGGCFDLDYEAMGGLARRVVQRLLRRSRVLFQTKLVLGYFRERFPGARCQWYPNSRPLEERSSSGPRAVSLPLRGVFVGHVKPEKGIRELLSATRELAPDAWQIDVFGPLLEGVEASELEGHPVVRYRGVLPPERVGATLSEYDLLLLPTYHFGEGYPGVILEAFTVGLAVLTTRWRAIPEIVEHGRSGILIEPRDAAALTAALRSLVQEPQKLVALSEGARAQAARFDSARWTEAFVQICRECARESGALAAQGSR